MPQPEIQPIVLAGGKGTRLWPVSREDTPKQFCKLNEGLSLFQNTMIRIRNWDRFAAPVIVTGEAYVETVRRQLKELAINKATIISEPVGKDTSAAILLAVEATMGTQDQLALVMPSDHLIADEAAFMKAVNAAADSALHDGLIVTFGIKPTHPDTGFGYLRAGEAFYNCSVCRLKNFVEKPDLQTAEKLIQENEVYWNAGIFLFNGAVVRDEFSRHAPQVHACISKSVVSGTWAVNVFRPHPEQFAKSPAISFDYAVMEKTSRAAMIPVSPGWSDLGSWKAIWETSERNADGNVIGENCFAENASNCLVRSDGPVVGIAGLNDIVVVASRDAVLVTSRSNPQDVKQLVETMKTDEIRAATAHPGEDRPWGRLDSIDRGNAHQVKRIRIDPGQSHSLHYHHHRSEHVIVVSGTATVTIEKEVVQLDAGQQALIPQGAVHRLENRTGETVELIEVQIGACLGDDDIVRLDDQYGRTLAPASPLKTAA